MLAVRAPFFAQARQYKFSFAAAWKVRSAVRGECIPVWYEGRTSLIGFSMLIGFSILMVGEGRAALSGLAPRMLWSRDPSWTVQTSPVGVARSYPGVLQSNLWIS
jgi:hypothetical protein